MQFSYQKIYLFLLSFLFSAVLFAQQKPGPRYIQPIELAITCDQTSILLFPAAIKRVDRGSRDILTKTVEDISNVLKLKAANDSMKASNLHVFTADGQVYPFSVKYHPLPLHLTIDMNKPHTEEGGQTPVAFNANRLNEAQINQYTALISELKPGRNKPRSKRKGNAQLSIQGTYYVKGVLFFQVLLVNTSPIPYHINFTSFYIRDKKSSRRTSITEKEIQPLYSYITEKETTNTPQQFTLVLAFDQFTIADDKYFSIEMFEQNGDRELICRIKGKDILRARKLLTTPEGTDASK